MERQRPREISPIADYSALAFEKRDRGAQGTYLISNHSREIGFDLHSPLWLDVQAFEQETEIAMHTQPSDLGDICRLSYRARKDLKAERSSFKMSDEKAHIIELSASPGE